MSVSAFPLQWPDGWPRTPEHNRIDGRAKFRRPTYGEWTFAVARDDLLSEFARLGAKSLVLSTNWELRRDGLPLASARKPEDQGVAVYFVFKGKQLSMARDQYRKAEHNMRSLSLAIDGLRQLERHGGSHMMERAFEGFVALPAPGARRSWREVLGIPADLVLTGRSAMIDALYRERAKTRHPDAPGGSHDAMAELNRAREEAMKAVQP